MKTLQIRVDNETRIAAEVILKTLGIDIPTAIRMYLKKIAQTKSIPFPLTVDTNSLTNSEEKEIMAALKDVEKGKNVSPVFDSAEDMIKHLRSEE